MFLHSPDVNHVNNFRDVYEFCAICLICRLSFQSMYLITNFKNDCGLVIFIIGSAEVDLSCENMTRKAVHLKQNASPFGGDLLYVQEFTCE